jgi:transposase InsO family protein
MEDEKKEGKPKPIKDKKPKEVKLTQIQGILNKLGVTDKYTKKPKYKFDLVKSNTFPKDGYNQMCDILMLPEDEKTKDKYLFVVIDIWSNYCDFEPQKSKTAQATLQAMQAIYNRNYVDKPKAGMHSDNGTEFKSVFTKWLKDHHIAHFTSLPYRSKQLANINNLCLQLGKIIMTYLTDKSMELKQEYTNWTSILPTIREELNKVKQHPKDEDPFEYPMGKVNVQAPPKYNEGNLVYRVLEKPANGEFGKFRSGDMVWDLVPRKINKVLLYNNNWRYVLNEFPQVSYAENELLPAKETEEKFDVHKFIDKRVRNKKTEWLVHWKRYKKNEATWEPANVLKEDLGEDLFNELVKDYNDSLKKK